MSDDYGYFGKDLDGYVHYKQAFDRNFPPGGGDKKPSGGKDGCLTAILIVLFILMVLK